MFGKRPEMGLHFPSEPERQVSRQANFGSVQTSHTPGLRWGGGGGQVRAELLCTDCGWDSYTQARKERKLFITACGGGGVSLQESVMKQQPIEISTFLGVTFFVTRVLGGTAAMQPNSGLPTLAWNLLIPKILGYGVLSTGIQSMDTC